MSIQVSVLLVVRDEADHLINCIQSVEAQFDSVHDWELIIVDGKSKDGSKEIAKTYLKDVKYAWSILDNKKKTLAPGWNMGIEHAQGAFVIRPDAHAALQDGYIKEGVETLKSMPDVTAVGGVLETKSKGFWGNIIKTALSSRVGVGNSSFRTSSTSGYTDTVVYAVYRMKTFEEIGLFDEKLVRHQDNEMHHRMKRAGGVFYLNTSMIADYYCRDTLRGISKQMFNIGRYLPDIMFTGSLGIRHLMPFAFYGTVLLGLLTGLLFNGLLTWFSILLLGLYFTVILIETISKIFSKRDVSLLLLLIIIPVIHFNYAIGTFCGLIKLPFRKHK